MRAAIYTRYSSDRQREASTEDQARNCRRRIDAEGWQFAEHFRDEAISGSVSDRPGYQRMLKAAQAGSFDVLLVDDLSRLSRDQVEGERAIRRLEFAGMRVLGICDGYDSQSKSRKVQRGVRGLMNELFLDDLRDKVHRGQTGQALKQYWAGGKPYGYRLRQITDATHQDAYGNPLVIGTRLEIDAELAPTVREIFRRFADGDSPRSIAAALNSRGVPSPGSAWRNRTVRRGKGWMGSGVRAILRNPLYVGRYVWNTTRWEKDPDTGKRIARKRPESEQITHDMPELRIVDQDLQHRVERRQAEQLRRIGERVSDGMSRSAARRTGPGGKYILSGTLRCAHCGHAYIIVGTDRYGCASHKDGGDGLCANDALIGRKVAERIVVAGIKRELSDPVVIEEIVRRVRAAMRAPKPKQDSSARIATLKAEIANLTAAIASGLLSSALADRLKASEDELRRLQSAAPANVADISRLLPDLADHARRAVDQLDETLASGNVAKARQEIFDRVGAIKVEADEKEIRLFGESGRLEASLLRVAGSPVPMPVSSGWHSGGRI